MNRFFGFLLFGVLVSAAITAFGFDQRADVRLELVEPLDGATTQLGFPTSKPVTLEQARSAHLRLTISSHAYDYTGVLALRATGPVDVVFQTAAPYETRKVCNARASRGECRLVVHGGSDPLVIVLMARDSEATVQSLDFRVAEAKRSTAASGPLLLYGFLILLLLGPVFSYLQRWTGAEQVALIAVGSFWIALTSWQGLAVCYLFLVAGYVAIKTIVRAPGQFRALTVALVSVVLFVAFIKFVAPFIATSFANIGGMSLALPLGISYFAIRLVDMILAANAKAISNLNLRDYLAFMLLPQALPAGPILTYSEFQRGRLDNYSIIDFGAGAARVAVGLTKKVGADSFLLPHLTSVASTFLIQGWNSSPKTVLTMLFLTTAYVYLDFSAYSDLAIGAGRAGGRRIPENFDWPLLRSNIREYWRHWHMTLSQWVMRRVYLPAFLRTRSVTASMVSCMMVIGLWHALNLPWVFWAFHHGLAMAAENKWFDKLNARLPKSRALSAGRSAVGIVIVWFWVSVGHSFTRFASLDVTMQSYLLALAAPFRILLGF